MSTEAEVRPIVQAAIDTIQETANAAIFDLIAAGSKLIVEAAPTPGPCTHSHSCTCEEAWYAAQAKADLTTQLTVVLAQAEEGMTLAELNNETVEAQLRRGATAVLAYLDDRGRLVPEGGRVLTAEQVEDVEALIAAANPYSAPAFRLRALFPATEPAEEILPILHQRIGVNPYDYVPPAPAVPAEEETKADPRMGAADLALAETRAEVAGAVAKYPPFNSSHEGYAVLKEEVDELWDDVKANNVEHSIEEAVQVAAMAIRYITDMRTASSPVVPAPAETEWPTVDEIPEGVVRVKDRDGTTWKYSSRTDGWMYRNRAGHWVHGYPDACLAPFVAAGEGNA